MNICSVRSTKVVMNEGQVGEQEQEFEGKMVPLREISLKHLELMDAKGILRHTDFDSLSDDQLHVELNNRKSKWRYFY